MRRYVCAKHWHRLKVVPSWWLHPAMQFATHMPAFQHLTKYFRVGELSNSQGMKVCAAMNQGVASAVGPVCGPMQVLRLQLHHACLSSPYVCHVCGWVCVFKPVTCYQLAVGIRTHMSSKNLVFKTAALLHMAAYRNELTHAPGWGSCRQTLANFPFTSRTRPPRHGSLCFEAKRSSLRVAKNLLLALNSIGVSVPLSALSCTYAHSVGHCMK